MKAEKSTKKGEGQKRGFMESLSGVLEIPKDTLIDIPKIEMLGNREFLIESYKGIIEYSQSVVKVNTSKNVITLIGKDMQIKSMSAYELLIRGKIDSVEFS